MSVLKEYYPTASNERLVAVSKLWNSAKSIEPTATEGLSYGLPALKLNDRPLIGFSISKDFMSIYPFSPKIITALKAELSEYEHSKGAIRFTLDNPVPTGLIQLIVELRKEELEK